MTMMMDLIKYLTSQSYFISLIRVLISSVLLRSHLAFLSSHTKVDKVIQLYETMLTRHCAMIVGPTGGGKSVVMNTLVKAQTAMGIKTKCTTLNPKVCKRTFPHKNTHHSDIYDPFLELS